jgi:acetylserotonin O-methyltransferase
MSCRRPSLFAAGRILHLLGRVARRLGPGGGLLLAEKLLHSDNVGPLAGNLQSLNMLVCTEGRERSPEEYAALLRRAGFARVEWRRTGAPLDAVLARVE